jgi:hypothetical protein
VKALTWAYIAVIVIGAAIGVSFLLRKPRYVVSATGGTSPDSIAAYEQRIGDLRAEIDSLKNVLGRRGVSGRITVRSRISHVEQQLAALREAVRIWRSAHDAYGVGQAYRQCVLLYGSAQSACRALSFDTLPPEADTDQTRTE